MQFASLFYGEFCVFMNNCQEKNNAVNNSQNCNNDNFLKDEKNNASSAEKNVVKPSALKTAEEKKIADEKKRKAKIRQARQAEREKYFAYYDDIKTRIKEDW